MHIQLGWMHHVTFWSAWFDIEIYIFCNNFYWIVRAKFLSMLYAHWKCFHDTNMVRCIYSIRSNRFLDIFYKHRGKLILILNNKINKYLKNKKCIDSVHSGSNLLGTVGCSESDDVLLKVFELVLLDKPSTISVGHKVKLTCIKKCWGGG